MQHSPDEIQLAKSQSPKPRMLNTLSHTEETVSNQPMSEADVKQKNTVPPHQVRGEARNNTKDVACFVTDTTGLHWLIISNLYTLFLPLSSKVGALYSAVAQESCKWVVCECECGVRVPSAVGYVEDTFTLMWRPRTSGAEYEVPIEPNSTATLYEIRMRPIPRKMYLYIKDKDGVPLFKYL